MNHPGSPGNPADAPAASAGRSRSIDLLRGFAMVLMALDHTRDFFTATGGHPDLSAAPSAFYFTRWITHLCAPTFVFLAGAAARLSVRPSDSPGKLQGFLLKRGLWLMLLEITVMNVAWTFSLSYKSPGLGVIWALGGCMVLLSLAVRLPERWIAGLGIAIVVLHNALDPIRASELGSGRWLWMLLHERGQLADLGGHLVRVVYPFVPWIGVMMAGYAFGAAWLRSRDRAGLSLRWGLGLAAAFFGLRLLNLYGDPVRWAARADIVGTIQAFLNLEKYPPSLDYCLITLGISLCLLAFFERRGSGRWEALNVFGRVPLFYYAAHLYLIHAIAVLVELAENGSITSADLFSSPPPGWGHPLPVVYLVWALAVAGLYPLCAWYAGVKARSKNPLLRYL